jgi:hypothetical protein
LVVVCARVRSWTIRLERSACSRSLSVGNSLRRACRSRAVPGAVVAPPASAVGLAAAFDAAPDGAVEEDEEAAEAEAEAAAAALFLPDLGLRVIKKKKIKKKRVRKSKEKKKIK